MYVSGGYSILTFKNSVLRIFWMVPLLHFNIVFYSAAIDAVYLETLK